MFHKLDAVVRRFETLTERLGDPSLYDRAGELREINSERSHLEPIVIKYKEYKKTIADIEGNKDIIHNEKDEEMRELAKEELSELEKALPTIEHELKLLLLPRDPNDDRNVMIEIRAGAGGDEAGIFVGDVWRMYKNYFNSRGWRAEVVSISEGDVGIKELIANVSGEKVYSRMKYESGVHRVQRVPATETQGRVHTSTITVAVMPEADEVTDIQLDMNEIRIDIYRSSGAGGQSVNTADSAVRLTHIPTGIVVAMQDERSQLKNKDKAFKILKAKLYDLKVQQAHEKEAATRKGLVGTGDRSERIRTYNYPQGRISDHRINFTIYNLPNFMNGDIDEVIDALIAHNQAILLQGAEE
ncbi:MAG TPA: peptide chain release factor 1 [Bacteriovoracaceae bacterium]|nr:peptide chain release factor 1 [Bacteriovoracaceae bacterium]